MKSIILHSEAKAELDSAIAYYEEQQAGLGIEFLSEVEQGVTRIQQNPNIAPLYKTTSFHRYVLKRFPFLIFYREVEDYIWIAAIAHSKRKPDYWRRRQFESNSESSES